MTSLLSEALALSNKLNFTAEDAARIMQLNSERDHSSEMAVSRDFYFEQVVAWLQLTSLVLHKYPEEFHKAVPTRFSAVPPISEQRFDRSVDFNSLGINPTEDKASLHRPSIVV